jgi:hypothetical protein
MRLLTVNKPTADKPAGVSKKTETTSRADTGAGSKSNSSAKKKVESESAEEAAPAPRADTLIDYTRPTSSTELIFELQRRVIRLEESLTRKLTAAEYAIVLEAMTGVSLDKWEKNGYVIDKCHCENITCKGWTMTPIEHFRSGSANYPPKKGGPVTPAELKDIPQESKQMAIIDEDWDDDDLEAIFKQMFKEGLLKVGKNDSTIIPPDGPVTWTHAQMLAFAHGFDLAELKEHKGKPRLLQQQLIERLRGLGYKVNALPEPAQEAKTEAKPGKKATRKA